MENLGPCLLCVLLFSQLLLGAMGTVSGTQDGSEEWGYVEVRPKAHMFWWLYKSPNGAQHPSKPWPTVLWLQGGPGASGVGMGNFLELGPLDANLKPRKFTWLKIADLLFVDNPVGIGFSYVEDRKLLVKTDEEAATDLTQLLQKLCSKNKRLQQSPLYIVGESYGGKFATVLALSLLKAIDSKRLNLKLGGVALGSTWNSPEDYAFSWGPLLKDVSRLDDNGMEMSNGLAQQIKQQLRDGHYADATDSFFVLQSMIKSTSNFVDLDNFMLDRALDPLSSTAANRSKEAGKEAYLATHLNSPASPGAGDLPTLMNGAVRDKLKIIPPNLKWERFSDPVFMALKSEFMKPGIKEVDELLAKGVDVTVYSGQLDVVCSPKGTETWIKKLMWEGVRIFPARDRTPLYCGDQRITAGFTKSHKNLHYYWILGAGHYVPFDQPCAALTMVAAITKSPAAASF